MSTKSKPQKNEQWYFILRSYSAPKGYKFRQFGPFDNEEQVKTLLVDFDVSFSKIIGPWVVYNGM